MMRIVWIVLFVLSLISGISYGGVYYVDKNATGANNGTSWEDAWRGFGDINWDSIQPGDTIYISGGVTSETYTAPADSGRILEIKQSGEIGSPIIIRPGAAHPTLSAGHSGLVILDGEWTAENGIYMRNRQYVVVDGGYEEERKIKVTHTNNIGVEAYGGATGVKFLWLDIDRVGNKKNAHGMYISGGWGAEIAHNLITDAYQDGLVVNGCTTATDYGQGPNIHDNIIQNISDDGVSGDCSAMDFHNNVVGPWRDVLGSGHPDGMQIYYPKYTRIYNNTFWDGGNPNNKSNALLYIDVATPCPSPLAHIEIYNNVFFVSGQRYRANWWAILLRDENLAKVEDILMANNTFIDVPWHAIYFYVDEPDAYGLSDIAIKNNIIVNAYNKSDNGGFAIYLAKAQDYSNVVIDNNIIDPGVYGGQTIVYNGIQYNTVADFDAAKGTTNHICQPNFISYRPGNANEGDFHLSQDDSCAMNKGITLSSYFTIDKGNVFRPQGTAWDIGAYEYVDYADEDVNQDGDINISDVQLVVNVILGNTTNSRADVNGDGSYTISDAQGVANVVLGN